MAAQYNPNTSVQLPRSDTWGSNTNLSKSKLSFLQPLDQIFEIGKQINWPSNYGVLYSAISHGINSAIPQKKSSKSTLISRQIENAAGRMIVRQGRRTGRHRHTDLFNFNRISEEWTSYKSTYKTLPINLNKLILFAVRIWEAHCWHNVWFWSF